jgi:hypothetical protein
MKKQTRGPRSFIGYGSTATPTTSVEIEQPVAADPAAERAAQLRKRAQELLAEQAEQE